MLKSGGIMPATAAQPAGNTEQQEELAPLSPLLALARDLHIFLLESLKVYKKRLIHYWKAPSQD